MPRCGPSSSRNWNWTRRTRGMDHCPICESPCEQRGPNSAAMYLVECAQCGTYLISRETIDDIPGHAARWPSHWHRLAKSKVRAAGERGRPTVSIAYLERVVEADDVPSPPDQADSLVQWAGQRSRPYPEKWLNRRGVDYPELIGRLAVDDEGGVEHVLRHLVGQGLVETVQSSTGGFRLTLSGWVSVPRG